MDAELFKLPSPHLIQPPHSHEIISPQRPQRPPPKAKMSMSAMDSMDSMGMSGQNGAMTAYLHFTPFLDTLLFQYWVPTSPAAVLAACIGLFLLSIFDRWVAACRSVAEKSWNQSAQLEVQPPLPEKSESSNRDSKSSQPSSKPGSTPRQSIATTMTTTTTTTPPPYMFRNMFSRYNIGPPFIPSHDTSRGTLHAIQTGLSYLFMLASMTFQAAFIISMCLGAGVGEMMFGRYISGSSSHH